MKSIVLSILMFLLIINLSCARNVKKTEDKPVDLTPTWVSKKSDIRYPQVFYIMGVGVSRINSQVADENARLEIAKQIKVHLTGVDSNLISEATRIENDIVKTQSRTEASSGIESKVDIFLLGVKISEHWQDKKEDLFYSLAVLDIEKSTSELKEQMKNAKPSILETYQEAQVQEKEHSIYTSLKYYLQVYETMKKYEAMSETYRILNGEWKEDQDVTLLLQFDYSSNSILNKIEEMIANMNIAIVSGNEQKASFSKGLEEELKAKAVYKTKENEYPLAGIPMVFNFEKGKGEIVPDKVTDENGIIKVKVLRVESIGEKVNTISLGFDTENLFKRAASQKQNILPELNNKKVNFNYFLAIAASDENKIYSREEGIRILVDMILAQVKEKEIAVAVLDLLDGVTKKPLDFSAGLRGDIEGALAENGRVKIHLIERDPTVLERILMLEDVNASEVKFYMTGTYQEEKAGYKIKANLIYPPTQEIIATGSVMINAGPGSKPALETGVRPAPVLELIPLESEKSLEKLVKMKPEKFSFNVKVWTDKKDYQVGEIITLYFRSERDCYITLIDIGSSGNLTMLYPNKSVPDNFIQGGKVYSISGINVGGPAGRDRIKAIATLDAKSLLKTDYSQSAYYSIDVNNKEKTRDLSLSMDNFTPKDWAENYWDINIYYDNVNETYRGLKKKRPEKPIDIMGTQGIIEEKKENRD